MAAPATVNTKHDDGYLLTTYVCTATFGSSQETSAIKIDLSALAHADPIGSPTFRVSLESVVWSISGDGIVNIDLDGETGVSLANSGSLYGGDLSAPGGDVLVTTTGMASTDTYTLEITVRKLAGYVDVPVALSADITNDDVYETGDSIEATVVFSAPVFVTGVPTLELLLDTTVEALCTTPPNAYATELTFAYTVRATDHIDVGSFDIGDITLHGSADITGGFADSPARLTDLVVDGVGSVNAAIGVNVTTLAVALVPGTGPDYATGETVQFTVTASAAVTVTGTPRFVIEIGSGNNYASYVSGSGTTSLVFPYTPVVGGDIETAGNVAVASPVLLNSGTINNAAGNPVTLAFTPPDMSSVTFN